MNPFNPQPTRLVNFHPENIEQNKLRTVQEKTQMANGRVNEYSNNYKPKTYADIIKQPKTYADMINRPRSYSDANNQSMPQNPNNTILESENMAERVRNVNKPFNNFNGR